MDLKRDLNFAGSTIEIKGINIEEDYIEVYILHNGLKVQSKVSGEPNCAVIHPSDIGVTGDEFQQLELNIVNGITLSIEICISIKAEFNPINIKDNIKIFNQNPQENKNSNNKSTKQDNKEKQKKKSEGSKTNAQKNGEKQLVTNFDDKLKIYQMKETNQTLYEKKKNMGTNILTLQKDRMEYLHKLFKRKGGKSTNSKLIDDINENFELIEMDDALEESIVYLDPVLYTKYLDEQLLKGIKHPYRETFCEGFFISSFPKSKGNIIEKSNIYEASCGHKECSILPAMKPEIIFRYPLQDTPTLELNNLAATICFPTGIKVCYSEDLEPRKMVDYYTIITNQKGERYYMMNFHFYLRMLNSDYMTQYKDHPLQYHLRKFAEAYIGLSEDEIKEQENSISGNLESTKIFEYREFVNIPYCICLISKYPYIQEMEKCLESIFTLIKNEKCSSIKINDIIMYLINSIPVPPKNTAIKFPFPYMNTSIKLNSPKYEDLSIMNLNGSSLLKYFSIDNLILIFKLLINERKLLLIDNDFEKLATVADGLASILYPFPWVHTFIPIMSDQMMKYLETFLPFLNGIQEILMPLAEKVMKESESDDQIFLIYIRENKIKLSSTLRGSNIKLEKFVQENLANLPSQQEKDLRHKLKRAKSELDELEKMKVDMPDKKKNLEIQFRQIFIDLFVDMFKEYPKFLSMLEDLAVFNKDLFLEKIPTAEKKFYSNFMDTQLFEQFAQSVVNSEVIYFNQKITQLQQDNKNTKQTDFYQCNKIYCLIPEFLKTKNHEEKNLSNTMKDLYRKYPIEKGPKLYLDNPIIIDNSKYKNANCQIFFTPEELEEKKEDAILQQIQVSSDKTMDPRKGTILLKRPGQAGPGESNVEGYSEREKDEIKEEIMDFITPIFKTDVENMNLKEKKDIVKKLNMPFGRDFFATVLSKNLSNVILLKENSCHLLFQLIYNCLIHTLRLEETDKILEEVVLFIKSTRCFGVQLKKKTETMFNLYINKIGDFPKLRQSNFWQKWYNLEIRNNDKNKNNKESKQNVIYDICQILISLEYPKSMIKNFTNQINEKEFGKDSETYKVTFKKIIEYITKAQYISKVI